MDNCIHWFYLCVGFLIVIIILVAISYKYNLELKEKSVKLENNDRQQQYKHHLNEERIKELEKKNGHEQKQIDELNTQIETLKKLSMNGAEIKPSKENIKDLSNKVDTGNRKALADLNNLHFPEGYSEIYKKFSDLLDEDYLTKIIITSRGTGKSHNVKVKILEWITGTDRELIWLRRNFDNIRKSSLEPWRKILNKYCFEYTQQKISIRDFEEVWEAITRGVKYKNNMRLHFIELYKSEDARELLDKNVDIFMDEAIPNPKGKDKTNLKYLDDEDVLYDELYGSAWRERVNLKKNLPRKIFVANPYDRFGPFMRPFNKYLSENLKELKEKLWREEMVRIEVEEENLRGEKEKSLLYLYATEHKRELFEKEWGNFFLSEEALNMIKVPDNYEILYKLQGYLKCRVLRTGKTTFVNLETFIPD